MQWYGMEYLILVRDISALRAHVSSMGSVKNMYALVASLYNLHKKVNQTINRKACQDRYSRLKDRFEAQVDANAAMLGVAGGKMGDQDVRFLSDSFLVERRTGVFSVHRECD